MFIGCPIGTTYNVFELPCLVHYRLNQMICLHHCYALMLPSRIYQDNQTPNIQHAKV